MALSRDNHMCQHCLKEGKVTTADVVHHIIYVEHDLKKALTLDNLVCLCHAHHNGIHKDDDKRNKKKTKGNDRNIRVVRI